MNNMPPLGFNTSYVNVYQCYRCNYGICIRVSIHPMLMFIHTLALPIVLHTRFNTSYVNVYPNGLVYSAFANLSFNTSYVNVYPVKRKVL